jgi:hypothetical protein
MRRSVKRARRGLLFLISCTSMIAMSCDVQEGTSPGDDSIADDDPCSEGWVYDDALPPEFAGAYPDGCIPPSCGSAPWTESWDDETAVHVDADADVGGNGSVGAPFAHIQDGVTVAGAGGGRRVLVAAGTYLENLVFEAGHAGVEVRGRCAELVVVDGSGDSEAAGMRIDPGGSSEPIALAGFTLERSVADGVLVESGTVTLRDAVLADNALASLYVDGPETHVEIENVEIRGAVPTETGTFSRAIGVNGGAYLAIRSCLLADNMIGGMTVAGDDTVVEAVDLEVRNTLPNPAGYYGHGIQLSEGSCTLRATGLIVDQATTYGICTFDAGPRLELVDAVVRDTRPNIDDSGGYGLVVAGTDTGVDIVHSLFEANTSCGVMSQGEGNVVTLAGVVIRDTQPHPLGVYGQGLTISEGSRARIVDSSLQRNQSMGIAITGSGSHVELLDSEVTGTAANPWDGFGSGATVFGQGRLEATRCTFQGNVGGGITLIGDESDALLVDVDVLDSKVGLDGGFGYGVQAYNGAQLEMIGGRISGNASVGCHNTGTDTVSRLYDVTISQTSRGADVTAAVGVSSQYYARVIGEGLQVEGTAGPGVLATHGGVLSCSGCVIEDNAFAGALTQTAGELTLSDSTIRRNQPDEAAGGGFGVFVETDGYSATLHLQSTRIEQHAVAGVWLEGNGAYTIVDCEILDNTGLDYGLPDGTSLLLHGSGVVVTAGVAPWSGTEGLLLAGNHIAGHAEAGLLLDASSALTTDNSCEDNPVDLWWQDCADVEEPGGLADWPVTVLCPESTNPIIPFDFDLMMESEEPNV